MQLNSKLFDVKTNDRIVVITLVATVLLGKFPKDVLTALIPLELEILVHKGLTSRDTRYGLTGIFSILLVFRKMSLVSGIPYFL